MIYSGNGAKSEILLITSVVLNYSNALYSFTYPTIFQKVWDDRHLTHTPIHAFHTWYQSKGLKILPKVSKLLKHWSFKNIAPVFQILSVTKGEGLALISVTSPASQNQSIWLHCHSFWSVLKPSDVSKTGVYRCDYNLKETPLPKVTHFKGLNLYSYANFSNQDLCIFIIPTYFRIKS